MTTASPSSPLLTLRPAHPGDAPLLESWRREPSVRRHQPLASVSRVRLRTELACQNPRDLYRGCGDKFQWIVEANGGAVGWITLVVSNWEHGLAELGYALSTSFQGRGLMPMALQELLADLFGRTRLARLEARCSVDNEASQKVLERTGFRREGLLRGYFLLGQQRVDNYLYAILRDDWTGSSRSAPG